jgi:hypothetical protein
LREAQSTGCSGMAKGRRPANASCERQSRTRSHSARGRVQVPG